MAANFSLGEMSQYFLRCKDEGHGQFMSTSLKVGS